MKKNLILVGLLSVILVIGIISVVSAIVRPQQPIVSDRTSITCPTGWSTTLASAGGSCCVKSQGTIIGSRYTGKVTITGEMTQDKCDSYCSLSTGTLSSSSKQCDCSPAEILRNGRTFCTNLDSQKVCGELGRKTTANDGTQVTFTRERTGFFSQARILVNIRESTDSLSYQ